MASGIELITAGVIACIICSIILIAGYFLSRHSLREVWTNIHNSFRTKLEAEITEEEKDSGRVFDLGATKTNIRNAITVDIQETANLTVNLEKKWNLGEDSAKVIFSNQVIEHIRNKDNFFEQAHKTLADGGKLIIGTENMSSWHNIFALIMGWQAFSQTISEKQRIGNPLAPNLNETREQKPEKYGYPLHNTIFTTYGLRQMARLHGFKIEKTICWGYFPLWPWVAEYDKTHAMLIGIVARKVKK